MGEVVRATQYEPAGQVYCSPGDGQYFPTGQSSEDRSFSF